MFPDLEFIKTCLNGLRSRIEKVESWFVSNRPNWAQNDPDALDYVKGRTHYEANGKVVQLPPKFLPPPTSNTAGAIKADVAKTTDTQPVRLGTDGKLYASGIPVFTTSGTGSEYTAHVPEITNLVKGMLVVMIPHTDSTSQYPTLIINRGSSKNIARPVSTGGKSTFISLPNLKSGLPYLLIYTGSEWLSINNVRPDALDLTNFVTPNRGGTGLTSLTKGSYIIGNGLSSVQQKTPSEVLADIGAIPAPATASVGQTVVVKAVDEGGNPTEWAPATLPDKLPNPNALTFTGAVSGSYDGSAPLSVEIPSGGGGSEAFELLAEITTGEEVSSIEINTDANGAAFSCRKLYVYMKIVGSANNATSSNGNITVNSYRQNGFGFMQKEGITRYRAIMLECLSDNYCNMLVVEGNNGFTMMAQGTKDNFVNIGSGSISSLKLESNGVFGAGTEVYVFGVRA